jgi:hypothetical protein
MCTISLAEARSLLTTFSKTLIGVTWFLGGSEILHLAADWTSPGRTHM